MGKLSDEAIIARLKDIIRPYANDGEAMEAANAQTDFFTDLKVNSVHLVDIILDIEEAFDIEIDDQTAEEMLNLGQAVHIIQKLSNES